jgi:hypothetical protein
MTALAGAAIANDVSRRPFVANLANGLFGRGHKMRVGVD